MLTLKNITTFEALSRKSFADFDGTDEDDVLTLMYACDEQRKYTMHVYKKAAARSSERLKFVRSISEDIAYVNQFIRTDKTPQVQHKGKKIKSQTFTDTIMYIIYRGGLDATWVMNQGLEMLPILTHGLEEHIHQQMSDIKFWNLLKMSPHLQKKDNDRLRRSFTYPWEMKDIESKIDDMDIGVAVFAMMDKVKL